MEEYAYIFEILKEAVQPCWAELIGAFLMALMINLVVVKGTQRETFLLFSAAFYVLVLRSLLTVFFHASPHLWPKIIFHQDLPIYLYLLATAFSSALLITGAFKNLRIYFSAGLVVVILAVIFAAVSFIQSDYPLVMLIKVYLPPLYLMLSLFVGGISFYLNKDTRQYRPIRTMGIGFLTLSICYGYCLFDLLGNVQQVLFLSYTIAIILSLASQVQYLNIYSAHLAEKIEAEKRGKYEVWEFSPFPIIISRLRDDEILYINPTARQNLSMTESEEIKYPLSAYFIDVQKKEELLTLLRRDQIVRSFEVQFHHPEKNNDFWVSLTTRTTDMDEEIVLFTTFQDITEQKRTAEVLKEQAATDPLTGLFNRRQFEVLAYQALQAARRYQSPYSIGMLDIDFFKKINDTYGHDAGDAVLKNLATTLTKVLRKSDVIARFGGEEFVIFFTQTAPEEALVGAEHVREAVEKMITVVDNQEISITVSIGISDCRTTNLNVLVKQADDALYHSKENGRNRTTLYKDLRRSSAGHDDASMRASSDSDEGEEA